MTRSPHRRGFTLVEIMIVLSIIGRLAALAFPAWISNRQQSLQTTLEVDARQISSSVNQYFLDDGPSQVAASWLVGTASGSESRHLRALSTGEELLTDPVSVEGSFALPHAQVGSVTFRVADGRNN